MIDIIVVRPTAARISAIPSINSVIVGAAEDNVVSVVSIEMVIVIATEDAVIATSTKNMVVVVSSVENVVASTATDIIVSTECIDVIGTVRARDHIRSACAKKDAIVRESVHRTANDDVTAVHVDRCSMIVTASDFTKDTRCTARNRRCSVDRNVCC
jgi:hypothetical protein